MTKPDYKQVCALVEADHKPRVALVALLYGGHHEYRVAYWIPVLGVRYGSIHDTYASAQMSLEREDWEARAWAMLEGELDLLLPHQKELEEELHEVHNKVGRIQCALMRDRT